MNNSKQKTQQAISIMADFGNGPYAWRKDATDKTSYVGSNFVDTTTGFPKDMSVSKILEQQFSHWVISFEKHYDKEWFNWKEFNSTGLSLTQLLANELCDSYLFYYHKPMEDPGWEIDSIVEVYGNN